MRVLAFSGSLRAASHNTALLRAAEDLTPEKVEFHRYQGLEYLPAYNEDLESDLPASVLRLRQEIDAADALLFSTPEYNGTVPGHLKQAVDWASRPHGPEAVLWGKAAAVVGVSASDYGAMWAQDHLRKALGLAGARVLEVELPVGRGFERFDNDGVLTDLEIRDRLAEIVAGLLEHADELARVA